jgi:predicted nucleic acid-binding protein
MTKHEEYMETLVQCDWEAHRRDQCAAAQWAAQHIHDMEKVLREIASWSNVYPMKDARRVLAHVAKMAQKVVDQFESNNENPT